MFPRSYIYVSDTFTIIGLILETTVKFVNKTGFKVFGYTDFVTERIGKPCLTFKNNFYFAAI